MALFGNLYVGSSGLRTSQNALNTTAHNMSNIDTKGYTRQQIAQSTRNYNTFNNDTKLNEPMQTGLGVYYSNTRQLRDVFLDRSYRLESGRQAFYEVNYETIKEVEDLFQELNGTVFQETMANLWGAVQELSKDPTNATLQTQFVNRCNEFVFRSQNIYKGLVDYQNRMNSSVKDIVGKINNYAEQISELNKEISKIELGGVERANDLRDKRNKLLDELGKLGDITYEEDPSKNVIVSFEGVPLVKLDGVNRIGLDNTDSPSGYLTPYWEFAAKETIDPVTHLKKMDISGATVVNLTLPVSSDSRTDVGLLRGTLLARGDHAATFHDITDDTGSYYNSGYPGNVSSTSVANSAIMNIQAEFDLLFNSTIEAINKVMRNAVSNPATVSQKGSTEDYVMFKMADENATLNYNINATHLAGQNRKGLSVMNTKINEALLKDPALFSFKTVEGTTDNAAIEALKKAFTEEKYRLNPNTVATTSINGYYKALVSQIGIDGNVFKGIMESQEKTVDGISAAREEIHGVSQDEELQYMIQFQNAFNASSRYINVVNEMIEHLLVSLA